MKKKISIVDIAKALNISPTTVSFVLNGRASEKRISDKVVGIVEKYIKEVGYKPNTLARSLRTGKTNTIGLLVENIANPFFANVARAIEEKAFKNGYKILYSSTENDTEKTKELIQIYKDRHVDGYIISAPLGIEEDIKNLLSSNIPVVLFDRNIPTLEIDSVLIDNTKSTYNAVKHLIASGYENIAFITLDSLQGQMLDRLSGYENAIEDNKLTSYVKEISYKNDEESIISHITSFLERNKKIDAVIFATNYLGISGLKAIKRLGMKLREDMGLIVFDDHDLFELHTPSITAISQPIADISDSLINILLNKLKKISSKSKIEKIVLPTELIIRNSSVRE